MIDDDIDDVCGSDDEDDYGNCNNIINNNNFISPDMYMSIITVFIIKAV